MKPEKILQSDMLDLLFENRNKEYGAYELRRNYNGRITKALGLTALVVVTFGLMQSFKVPHRNGKVIDLISQGEVDISRFQEQKKEAEKPKEEAKRKTAPPMEAPPTKQFTSVFKIEKAPPVAVATQDDLEKNAIGNITKDGPLGKTLVDVYDPAPSGPTSAGTDATETKQVEAGPMVHAELMPEFPGGREALLKFLHQNLRQPDDFEEGQKMTVVAKFVVDEQGNIVNIEIAQNGRKDLDDEVMRVIRKMPKWKAGEQNGRKVAVYFKVPVTFVSPD